MSKQVIAAALANLNAAKAAHAAACAARGPGYRHRCEEHWYEVPCCGFGFPCRETRVSRSSMTAAHKSPEARAAHAAWRAVVAAKAAYRAAITPSVGAA
jgi:hypothetical protein